MISLELYELDDKIQIGVVLATELKNGVCHPELVGALETTIDERTKDTLPPAVEKQRLLAREVLRNGSYKPNGRGKPASEFLWRAARDGAFPKISHVVDANNEVSLRSMWPISIWDLDKSPSLNFQFRLGRADEEYVFNPSGQCMRLKDLLLCACKIEDQLPTQAIANPVKDSMLTKTSHHSQNIAAAIYAHRDADIQPEIERLGHWLSIDPHAQVQSVILSAKKPNHRFELS